MPDKKSSKITKTTKKHATKKSEPEVLGHKDPEVARALRLSGILMMIASVFMILVPFMYRGVYSYVARNTNMPQVDDIINFSVSAGSIIALVYCLLGIFVFRAGEDGTFLAKGITAFNNFVAVLAILAAVMVFLSFPDQTFQYAIALFRDTDKIVSGVIPMSILTLADLACIVGIVLSVATIDDICVFKKRK